MSPAAKLSRLSIATFLALTVSVIAFSPALADGETPPPPDAGTTEAAPDSSAAEITQAPTEEAAPTEQAVTTEEVAPDAEPIVETAVVDESASSETTDLATLPEGTELVVVSADGESLPLASEEAAEIVATGDPLWCPTGVAPVPDITETICSDSYSSMADLIANFVPYSNGVIWIEDGTLVDAGVTIDGGGSWSTAAAFSLTLQGGWNAISGSTALDPVFPYTTFDGQFTDSLQIKNWVGPVTIKNIIINSYAPGYSNSVSDIKMLLVQTAGNIVLDKVQVYDALNTHVSHGAYGAYLDNTSGAGNVTVTNSSFSNNESAGLAIFSNGTVTLKNVYAFDNGQSGIYIDNNTASPGKAVSITNAWSSDNGDAGVWVISKGSITLNNISADLNGAYGAFLENFTATYAAPITVNGINSFSGNSDPGLYAESDGAITVSKVTANENGTGGVVLTNLGSPFSVGVTISGYLNANYNGGQGLRIASTGAVLAANLITSSNGLEGTQINNTYYCPITGCVPKNVTINGYNYFNDNGTEGLEIQSRGTVLLNNLTAIKNGYLDDFGGVLIDNDADPLKQMAVTLNGYNVFSDNSNTGLSINSYGAITLNNITAVNNGKGTPDSLGDGVYLENLDGLYAKAIAIKGVNVFSNNDGNGLTAVSDGTISLSKTTANSNGWGVGLDTQLSPVGSGVTISGYLIANDNSGPGLVVNSAGAVTAANLTTNNNGARGAQIINDYYCPITGCVSKNVTITGYGNFIGNDYEGLYIRSRGTVLLYNLTANDNGFSNDSEGVEIDNDPAVPAVQPGVTLSGVNTFINNARTGLRIDSLGSVTVSNITALDNGKGTVDGLGYGVWISNDGGIALKNVAVNGVNVFNNNDQAGLYIYTKGAITVSKPTAFNNGTNGVILWNQLNEAQSNVTVTGYGVMEYNGSYPGSGGNGLVVYSNGSITLANITAQFNKGFGADINTYGLTTSHTVTMTGTNSFNYNGDGIAGGVFYLYESGLNVNADGNITVYNLTASYNYFSGAMLDNDTNWFNNDYRTTATPSVPFTTFGSVFVYGFGNFVGNETGYGLWALSHGNITINRVVANGNGDGIDQFPSSLDDAGIRLEAGLDGGIGTVTVVCSSAYGNTGQGIYATSPTSITLKGLLSYGNTLTDTPSVLPITLCP